MKETLIKIINDYLPLEINTLKRDSAAKKIADALLENNVYISKLKLGQGVVWAGYDKSGKAFAIPSIVRGINYTMVETDPDKVEIWYLIEAKTKGPKEPGEMEIVTEDQLRIDPEVIGIVN